MHDNLTLLGGHWQWREREKKRKRQNKSSVKKFCHGKTTWRPPEQKGKILGDQVVGIPITPNTPRP
jgi:hypothetical protein